MKPNKYAELDAAILVCIREGRSFTGIAVRCSILALAVKPDAISSRTVDRRLQYMRKAGKIAFNSKTGWAIVEAETA